MIKSKTIHFHKTIIDPIVSFLSAPKVKVLFISILFMPCILKASGDDRTTQQDTSLVYIEEIEFTSPYEEEQFVNLLKKSDGVFETLMSLNEGANEKLTGADKSMLLHEINLLKQTPPPNDSDKRRAKYYQQIYDRVHDRFLKKYELENYFHEIFTSGNYNCVSACALYGLVFEELDIPYLIRETPTHVYLMIDPNGSPFIIETTDPTGGISKLSQKFKVSFIEQLKTSKLMDLDDASSLSTDELFDKYYFTDKELNMSELVGVQYWNQGLFELEEEKYRQSMSSFQKSYLLYPNDKVEELLLGTLALVISKTKYASFEDANLIVQFSRFDSTKISNSDVENEFLRLNHQQLVENGDAKLYTKSYSYIIEHIRREGLIDELTFYYNYEMSRTRFNKGFSEKSLEYALTAYQLKPKNTDVEGLVLNSLSRVLQYESDQQKSYDLIDSLAVYCSTLMNNSNFGSVYLNMNLIKMDASYRQNLKGDGDFYREKFEQLTVDHPTFKADPSLVGRAYSQQAIFHFRKGNYTSAKRSLERGLSYAPNSVELQNRMRAIGN